MKKTKFFAGLGAKIILSTVLSVIVGIASITFVSLRMFNTGYYSLSSHYVNSITDNYAHQIRSQIDLTVNTAESLSHTIEAMTFNIDAGRDDILDIVAGVLESQDELVGIGVGFEPNAFDRNDSANIGKKHSDRTGRFVPYTFKESSEKEDNKIDYTILIGYDETGPDSSWYTVPKETKKTYVTDPYWYEVGSEKYWIFTCVSPILGRNGEFLGMVGLDTKLTSLNGIIQDAKLFDTGYLGLISPDGTVAYHPDSSIIGLAANEVFPAELVASMNLGSDPNIQASEIISEEYLTLESHDKHYTLAPIKVGGSGGEWIVVTVLPVSEIGKVGQENTRTIAVLAVFAAILIALVIGTILHLTVIKPINIIKRATSKMAAGNLNVSLEYKSGDEFGQLVENVANTSKTMLTYITNISDVLGEISRGNIDVSVDLEYIGDFIPIKTSMLTIIEYLNKTISLLSKSASYVYSNSEQVAAGAQTLSQGSTEQAASVEELAVTMDEMATRIKDMAENASQASVKAGAVGEEAADSNTRMQSMLLAMEEINNRAGEIRKIIGSIEEIAFQTNILALNAAVEAARAGSAGKGFAVVADEVRNLANKSAEASKNTAALIDVSLKAVKQGVDIANKTAQALLTVTSGIREVAEVIDDISNASASQASSVSQVVQGVNQISVVVQTTSATAEESAAVSEELSVQVQVLNNLVNHFHLKKSSESTAPHTAEHFETDFSSTHFYKE